MMGVVAPSLVAGFGAYLLYAYASGALYFYIHPIYVVPTVVAGVVLVVVALLGAGGRADAGGHDQPSRLSILLWAVPVAVGFLLPASPLGVSTAAQRGVELLPLGRVEDVAEFRVDIRHETLTIKDWVNTLQADPEPERVAGKPVRVIGFVFSDNRLPADWFLLARFVVQCCAVDAQPIGIPVRLTGMEIPRDGAWVVVHGTWAVAPVRGERRAVVVPTAIIPTERPDQPYLY